VTQDPPAQRPAARACQTVPLAGRLCYKRYVGAAVTAPCTDRNEELPCADGRSATRAGPPIHPKRLSQRFESPLRARPDGILARDIVQRAENRPERCLEELFALGDTMARESAVRLRFSGVAIASVDEVDEFELPEDARAASQLDSALGREPPTEAHLEHPFLERSIAHDVDPAHALVLTEPSVKGAAEHSHDLESLQEGTSRPKVEALRKVESIRQALVSHMTSLTGVVTTGAARIA